MADIGRIYALKVAWRVAWFAMLEQMLRTVPPRLWQKFRVRRLLRFVQGKSPFYADRSHVRGSGKSVPVIAKADIAGKMESVLTKDIAAAAGIITYTSTGTAGMPATFAINATEALDWLSAIIWKSLRGWMTPRMVVTVIYYQQNELYESATRAGMLYRFYRADTPSDILASDLMCRQPHVIVAPPSVLSRMSTILPRGSLTRLRLFILAGEVRTFLDDTIARYVSDEAVIVRDLYQASEGFLGISCTNGLLHLNEDIVVIERRFLTHGRGRFSPVVTDLQRRLFPIIRYQLDDLLVDVEGRCKCGSPFQAVRMEGRVSDILVLFSEACPIYIFPSEINDCLEPILSNGHSRHNYTLRQIGESRIVMKVSSTTPSPAVLQEVHSALAGLVMERGAQGVEILVMADSHDGVPSDRKNRRITRYVHHEPTFLPLQSQSLFGWS